MMEILLYLFLFTLVAIVILFVMTDSGVAESETTDVRKYILSVFIEVFDFSKSPPVNC